MTTLQELLNSDVDARSIAAFLRQGFIWWIDELANLLPASWRDRFSTRPRILAEHKAGGGWRFWRGGHPLADGRAAREARPGVRLLLPPASVLVRRIEVPRMPATDVRRMLALDLDRLSPLAPELVHFDAEIVERDAGGGRQGVLLGITPRAAADRLIEEARAEGLSPASLGVGVDGDIAAQRFDFLPQVLAQAGGRAGRRPARYWWAAAAALIVINLAVLVGRDMADVARLRGAVAAQAPTVSAVMRLRAQIDAEETRRRELIARGAATEPLRMLSALTLATPAGAWVQRLEWNGKAARIVGFKSADLDMIAAIRGSGFFTNPRSLNSQATPPVAGGQPFDITADARARAPR